MIMCLKKGVLMKKKFEFLEHTADIYVASYGRNLKEVFKNAALALFEVMTEVKNVEPKIEREVYAEGHDLKSLLYDWLEALIILFETESLLLSRFKIINLEEKDGVWRLKAKVVGEEFDSSKHLQKVGVKAITYHRMEITEEDGLIVAKFILDI